MHIHKYYLAALILIFVHRVNGQADKEIRLLVRADDIGFCHAVNNACIDVFTNGIARSVEILVPSPWFPEAVKLLKKYPQYDVGVHLCLTSEWVNMKWRPMTDGKTLVNKDGYFCPFIWPNDMYPSNEGNFLLENNPSPSEIEVEFRKQIETAKKYIPQLSHLSGHMGCTHANEQTKSIAEKLAKEYGLYFDLGNKIKLVNWGVNSDKSLKEAENDFISKIKKLEPGTYITVEHPGYDNEEMKPIYVKEGDNVAQNRQIVTNVWTSERVKKMIRDKKIKLISYKDLIK